MPIRADLRHLYKCLEFREARRRAVLRSGDTCEQCGKPNRTRVESHYSGGLMWWRRGDGDLWRRCDRRLCEPPAEGRVRLVKVICTLAHLNHDPTNNSDGNTRLLCQWCHLNHDRFHHHLVRALRKDGRRPLLAFLDRMRA